jgi:hypothetical protein
VNWLMPVTLPPGRFRLGTRPTLTGPSSQIKSIGIVVVARLAESARRQSHIFWRLSLLLGRYDVGEVSAQMAKDSLASREWLAQRQPVREKPLI